MASETPEFDEQELDSAERALGTLPRGPESGAQGAGLRTWDATLAPLGLAVPEATPPPGLFGRLIARITEDEADIRLKEARKRELSALRTAAGCFALATAMALALVVQHQTPPTKPAPAPVAERYVAVVTPGGGGEALLVAVDIATGEALVTPYGVAAAEGRDLELWVIEGGNPPRSLGLIDPQAPSQLPLDAAPGAVIAVSSEPTGGSLTGAPTGPVLYTGPLRAVGDESQ